MEGGKEELSLNQLGENIRLSVFKTHHCVLDCLREAKYADFLFHFNEVKKKRLECAQLPSFGFKGQRHKRILEPQITEDYKSIFTTHAGDCCGFRATLHTPAEGRSSLILLSAVQACLLFAALPVTLSSALPVTLSSAGFVHAV